MKKLLAVALLVLSSPVVFARTGDSETWKGYVSDTHCGTSCKRTAKAMADKDCVHSCVKQGAKYALASGTHVYVLEPQAEAAKFAAENVQVTGSLSNNAIHITSITPVAK